MSRMFRPCIVSMGKLVPKGPRMPTRMPRSAFARKVVRFPAFRMQSSMSPRLLGALVGSVVLAVALVTVGGRALPRTRWTLLTAGVISGASGTSTSIGGPPVALLYAGGSGPQVRASLSAFLFAGNTLAVAALALAGRLPGRDVAMGAIFLVFAAAGFAAAARLRRFLDGGRIRAAVLVLASASAIVLIARSLLG